MSSVPSRVGGPAGELAGQRVKCVVSGDLLMQNRRGVMVTARNNEEREVVWSKSSNVGFSS